MKTIIAAVFAFAAVGASAQTLGHQYPSCDLTAQHAIKGTMGKSVTDPRQAHILTRANILQADLGTAKKAGVLSGQKANALYRRVARIKQGANDYTKKQGFLSGAELASYDRSLDAVAKTICSR